MTDESNRTPQLCSVSLDGMDTQIVEWQVTLDNWCVAYITESHADVLVYAFRKGRPLLHVNPWAGRFNISDESPRLVTSIGEPMSASVLKLISAKVKRSVSR